MMNFGGEPPIFLYFFTNFSITHPCLWKICRKKGPLFREFGAQKPTHMGGTYPYPQHVMYPPPPGGTRANKNKDYKILKVRKEGAPPLLHSFSMFLFPIFVSFIFEALVSNVCIWLSRPRGKSLFKIAYVIFVILK